MKFNPHWNLQGKHATLSASTSSWIRYDREAMINRVKTMVRAARGTALHDLAKNLIELGVKLEPTGQTLNAYVNDCIGYRMTPEQILYYSDNCFGTADAIDFRLNKKTGRMRLRVFDLKTGKGKTSVNQLEVYVALFCLEYEVDVNEIEIDARIYQNDQVFEYEIDPVDILNIQMKIKEFDRLINEIRMEETL